MTIPPNHPLLFGPNPDTPDCTPELVRRFWLWHRDEAALIVKHRTDPALLQALDHEWRN